MSFASRLPVWLRILIGVAGLGLIAWSAPLLVRHGVDACGPGTYGGACSTPTILSLLVLLAGAALYLLAAPPLLSPAALVWLALTCAFLLIEGAGEPAYAGTALVAGAVALAAIAVADVLRIRRRRRSAARRRSSALQLTESDA